MTHKFLLKMINSMTYQNINLSFWDILCACVCVCMCVRVLCILTNIGQKFLYVASQVSMQVLQMEHVQHKFQVWTVHFFHYLET